MAAKKKSSKKSSKKSKDTGTRKIDIVRAIANKLDYSKNDVKAVIDEHLNLIHDKLMNCEEVSLSGVGSFKVRNRKARTGFNPITKEKIPIPARPAIKFKLSKDIRKALKEKTVEGEEE